VNDTSGFKRPVYIKTLQVSPGHADASLTLNRYSHLIPSDGRAAAGRIAEFLLQEESVTTYGHLCATDPSRSDAA
jgi:hypothetical protein